ncbi:MAG: transcription repressor NadR [Oscillospiraceae bacterium]|jgi:transcriptional regulator of NAD metabolism|nr:transcription repressor NadR [Oscillospiraceae bacterium]
MDAAARRAAILSVLERADHPVSAAALARKFSVSRQIIVGDVALLRAGGLSIAATPRGYMLPEERSGLIRTLACRHRVDQMEIELNAIVDQGCTVIDVIVEHPIYGQLTGPLQLSSRYDVAQFVARCRQADALPLSNLTEGIHLHTISCPDETALQRVQTALERLGVLLEE